MNLIFPETTYKYKVHADIRGCFLGRGVKQHWGLSTTAIFGDLGAWLTSSKTSELRQAILYDDMLPLVDRQMIAK